LKANVIDNWTWELDHDEGYPMKGVYHVMMQVEHDEPMALKNLIRNKVAPLNVILVPRRVSTRITRFKQRIT